MMAKNEIKLEKAILSFISIMFISSLIIYDLESNVIYSNLINLVLWIVFAFIFIFSKKTKLPKNPIFRTYLIFSIFAFLSILWAFDVNLVLDFSLRLIVILINLFVLYILLLRYDLKQSFLIGIIMGSLYNYMIALNFIEVSYETYEFGRFLGSVGNPNKLSKTMILSIFSSLMLLKINERSFVAKLLLYMNIVFAFFIIFLTASKQALILAPILFIFSTKINTKVVKLIFYIPVISVLLYYFLSYIPDELLNFELVTYRIEKFLSTYLENDVGASTSERQFLISAGLNQFYENPIFGVGMNNFRYIFTKYAHNTYLELLVGLGIIGFSLFYSIHLIIIKKIIYMKILITKRVFILLILVILAMDFVTVTYLDKLILFTLLFIYTMALEDKNIFNES